jgi:N-acetylglucosamine-6-phosphate deacetylase
MKLKFLLFTIFLFANFSSFCMKTDSTSIIEGINYADNQPISVSIKNGKIVKISKKASVSNPKFYLAPGLIDLQINGFMGVDFSDPNLSPEAIKKATNELRKVGVTTFLPTVITNDQNSLLNSFALLSVIFKDADLSKSIPGFHLEGPYISPKQGFRGVHLEKYIRNPAWNELTELQKAAQNGIKLITLAPESEGAISFIETSVKYGIKVALGHHNGSTEQINEAVAAGASLSTHLGNGCANMIDRHKNPLWPQLANDKLSATIIADGFHLNQEELQCFYKMKGQENTILVSDALDLAGMPPGEYIRDGKKILLTENVAKYPAENVLAGAASPIDLCITNIMKATNCGLKNAINMATKNPAQAMGFDKIGEIKIGKLANLILFSIENEHITIEKTLLEGKVVYSKN